MRDDIVHSHAVDQLHDGEKRQKDLRFCTSVLQEVDWSLVV